ncbi:two-component system chemotaxis response regulator CheY [Oxalobacteraceae bacterium GrIS 2.11]
MLKVVVMDGNAISRGLLSSVLTDGGHLVVGDSNVSFTGIARMVKLKPQLICIDLAMVDGDQMEVLDKIRNELPKTIIFLVSNSFDAEGIKVGQEHGVRGFIVKPFNTARVLTAIRNAVVKFVDEIKKSSPADPASNQAG